VYRPQARPVEPNPSSPRSVASNELTVEGHLHHGHDDHLRNAVQRLDGDRRLAPIPGTDHQRSLVIRVNQAHQVAQHDALFVPQP
jgi:hypothetical protein